MIGKYIYGLNEGLGSNFSVGSRVRYETPEEGWMMHQLKHCEYNHKDKDISRNTLIDKNLRFISEI